MGALRVVCYVNQFFGQLGAEEKAGVGPQVGDGAVGAARAVQQALGDAGTVVATVICGDNYAAEQPERAVAEMLALVTAQRPDLVIAGPAFLAGRYGVACGALCVAVSSALNIPAITGMHAENPGVDLYRRHLYIVQTGSEAARMLDEVRRLVALGLKLARGESIGGPAVDGYFPRGVTHNVVATATAAERATAMLLDKLAGRPFASEVPLPDFQSVPAPRLLKTLEGATIALVTDGGLVPRGNPDRIEPLNATRYGAYSIEGKAGLDAAQYDNPHRGYDTSYVKQDPHRLVPVDVARDLERDGAIGKLHE
ncbi:MAG TPA: glycine/betaine/sarcosine/D-proline family reductase selenoprotein B, partial [Methylomirabilota bacterium]|nr:glycine/betaine/sarcosine/D-proline family reductase selenoprotein B [Methylomirabilota bacterium]